MKSFPHLLAIVVLFALLQSCRATRSTKSSSIAPETSHASETINLPKGHLTENTAIPARAIDTKNVEAGKVVDFAETLVGVPYKYGSAVKEKGFDCSGFINYVFNHFEISVPRISRDFTNAGAPVPLEKSKRGDLILFTGTDTTGWVVGHMGFITENRNGTVKFIHSSSGRSVGVIISGLSKYYATRFVKVVRVFGN